MIGAVIDLGNCLDLLNRENIELVREAHALFVEEQERSGLPIPQNRSLDGEPDKILRFLDRAVIQFLHEIFDAAGEAAFDSVRGLFPEGEGFIQEPDFATAITSRLRSAIPSSFLVYFTRRHIRRGKTEARKDVTAKCYDAAAKAAAAPPPTEAERKAARDARYMPRGRRGRGESRICAE